MFVRGRRRRVRPRRNTVTRCSAASTMIADEVPGELPGVLGERASLRVDARVDQEQPHQGEPQPGPRDHEQREQDGGAVGFRRRSQWIASGSRPEPTAPTSSTAFRTRPQERRSPRRRRPDRTRGTTPRRGTARLAQRDRVVGLGLQTGAASGPTRAAKTTRSAPAARPAEGGDRGGAGRHPVVDDRGGSAGDRRRRSARPGTRPRAAGSPPPARGLLLDVVGRTPSCRTARSCRTRPVRRRRSRARGSPGRRACAVSRRRSARRAPPRPAAPPRDRRAGCRGRWRGR